MGVVLTMGTFDLPHPGHVSLLRECSKLAGGATGGLGWVVVAVNTDDFVARFKRQPLMTWDERSTVIGGNRYVNEIIGNDGLDQAALIESVRPDFLVIGADWATRDYYGQLGITADWLAARGISLVYVAHERSTTVSTTELLARLADR